MVELENESIGIVTVLYNSDEVIEGFIESLARQEGVRFKLYVIDNSPTPETLERCRTLSQQHEVDAECVFNGENVGVAKGNNQGIALALRDRCRYVLLANNDTEFGARTIHSLLQSLTHGDLVATPKIRYFGPERTIWYAGGRLDAWTVRTPHLGMGQPDRGQYDDACFTGYAPTCFLMVDASVFGRVGVMDENYFVYYDDTDFMWRLRCAGIRTRYEPSAMVEHKVSTSTGGGSSPFSVYYQNRNRIYFIRKNFRGLHWTVAISYTLLTRLPNAVRMSRSLAKRLWLGVRDGLRMPLQTDAN